MDNPRTHTLDNFRTSLTALVILHHASTPYGGAGSWSYTSSRYYPNSSPALVLFNVTNQTFFMGSCFLVSAYFSDIKASAPSTKTPSQGDIANAPEEPEPFRTAHVLATLGLISTSSFLIRLYYPVGRAFWPLFLQLAYASQYLTYYTAGIYIHRSGRSLQNAISSHTLRIVGTITASIASLSLFHIKSLLDTGMSFPEIVPLIFGGPNLLAFLYAFFNEFAGLTLASLLLKAFYNPRLAFLSKRWMPGRS
ncbi:hypothetical protein J4E89_009114 [Alternaria sp. Ai002NY15]|nr:hypothetical protein J4E89_009114 [Alternaria sp. Ai002NY15]